MNKKLRNTLGPLFLMLACPPAVMLIWYTNTVLKGSLSALIIKLTHEGLFTTIAQVWGPRFFGSVSAWTILAVFMAFQLFLMKCLPGKKCFGSMTPKGNVPVYKSNGVPAFFITLGAFCLCSSGLNLFSPTIIYDHLGEIFGALNLFSLIFCLFLYLKGRFFPSSNDSGITGNFFFDYYWGTELHPRVFGWDLKQFTNCRFGMMGWGVILLSYAAKQKELYGLSDSMVVSVILQLAYIMKFFFWEGGYLRSLDIMHDRAGFYICWGCLVWVPCVYTSPAMYLVNHPIHLGPVMTALFLLGGGSAILINYLADRQRYMFRSAQGRCLIWRRKPKITLTQYVSETGEKKEGLLLASGWWGFARHFHYLPELFGALFWSLPALATGFMPYFYVLFLTILLFDRAFRDDARCAKKYGDAWETHCEKVPYKIIPYII